MFTPQTESAMWNAAPFKTPTMNRKLTKPIRLAFLLAGYILTCTAPGYSTEIPNPNQFEGSDTERIQAAVQAAKGTSNKIVIPAANDNGSYIWKIDNAILDRKSTRLNSSH